MEYENKFGLYVGKPVGEHYILAILPQVTELTVDCAISDGDVWRFHIDRKFPNLEIGTIDVSKDTYTEWIYRKIGYYILKGRVIKVD